ncbi:hypothetical protein ECN1_2730 [Escherichia coli N1]|nr:hypothetical protein ECN1_2730 [Escherichia coli N1]
MAFLRWRQKQCRMRRQRVLSSLREDINDVISASYLDILYLQVKVLIHDQSQPHRFSI